MGSALRANVFFQDIVDQTLNLGQFALLDATGDGSADIAVSVNFSGNTFIALSTPTLGNVGSTGVQTLVGTAPNARALAAGVLVSSATGTYVTGGTSSCSACVQNAGDWIGGQTDAYIGFRFTKLGSNTLHYGWLRVSVNPQVSSIVIREIAYETAPNLGILTGFVPATGLQIQGAGGINSIGSDDGNLQIESTFSPSNATVQTLTWSVDAPSVATINTNGLLTALTDGQVLVRAQTQDGTNLSDTVRIFISNQIVPVASIEVAPAGGAMAQINTLSGSLQMEANVLPLIATNRAVRWSVIDAEIASVDEFGLVQALRNGTTRIVASSIDGSRVSGSAAISITGQPVLVQSLAILGAMPISSPFGSLQLSASTLPANATNGAVYWSVSPLNVASIDANGLLQAYANGTATVRAQAQDGSGVFTTQDINISGQLVPLQAITLNGAGGASSITAERGSLQMQASFVPANASNTNVRWSVNDASIASISADGRLRAHKDGQVTVSALAQDGSGVAGSSIISISGQWEMTQSLTVQGTGGLMAISVADGSLQMEGIFSPASATMQDLVWKSSAPQIASISAQGLLSAHQNGSVTVTAITQDGSGVQGTAVIQLQNQALLTTNLQLQAAGGATGINVANGSLQLTPIFTPSGATNQNLVWRVDAPTIAIIDQNGLLRALRNGSITVSATTQDGSGIVASISLLISNQPIATSSLQIVASSTAISTVRDTLQLSTLFTPTNATNTAVSWHSSNPLIATVSNDGILSAVSDGVVTITALAQDGSNTAGSQAFTISNQRVYATSINLSTQSGASSITATADSLQLLANIVPANATSQAVFWSVDNPQLAYIQPNGLLIALRNGTVTVSAQTLDGTQITSTMPITISNQPVFVQSMSLQGRTQTLGVDADTMQLYLDYLPANATQPQFVWHSSNAQIAAISQSGMLTARSNGAVTVSAHAYDGSAVFAEYPISITGQRQQATGLSIQGQAGTNAISSSWGSLQMEALFTPALPSSTALAWSLNNTSVAEIFPNGVLRAKANAVLTVSAATLDGSELTSTFIVSLSGQPTLVQSIALAGSGGQSAISVQGGSLSLIADILPTNASNTQIAWRSSDPLRAQVSQTGIVYAQSNGTVTISALATDGGGVVGTIVLLISNQIEPITQINVSGQGGNSSISIPSGTLQILASVLPAAAPVQWAVHDPNLAQISPSGLLKARADGIVQVIASAQDGSGVVGFMDVHISNQPILVSNISLNGQGGQTSITSSGGSLQLLAAVLPANADNPNLLWQIAGGTGWAQINPTTGLLTAERDGMVVVRARSTDGSEVYGEINISISGQLGGAPNPTGINISGAASINQDDGFAYLTATVAPFAANGNIIWDLEPVGIANIDQAGKISAFANGTITVTATSVVNGLVGTHIMSLSNQILVIDDIVLQGAGGLSAISVANGSLQIEISALSPVDATNTDVLWRVDDPNLAQIDANGLLTAFADGSVLVSAQAQDGGGAVGSININLSGQPVYAQSLSISPAGGTPAITASWGSLQMLASLSPASVSVPALFWSVDDTNIATIDPNGLLQARGNGTVMVSARTSEGSNIVATLSVNVSNQPISVSAIALSGGSSSIATAGGSIQLSALLTPANATNPDFIWAVDNPMLAAISREGIITAIGNGSTFIRAYSQDGSGIVGSFSLNLSNQIQPFTALQIQGTGGINSITTAYGVLQMEALVTPSSASFPAVAWSVDNPLLAHIDVFGRLRARRNGSVTVFAHSQDGSRLLASQTISISNQLRLVQSITLTQSSASINTPAGTAQFAAEALPTFADNRLLLAFVDNPNLANINRYGMLTAFADGAVAVRHLSQDGSGTSRTDTVQLTNQYNQPSSLLLSSAGGQTQITTAQGSLQISASPQPSGSPFLTYYWTVSPAGAAAITSSGLLIAQQNAQITVTAVAMDGSGASGQIVLQLLNQPIFANSLLLQSQSGANTISTLEGTLQMLASIAPANATYSNVAWSLSNPTIARISRTGLLTATANGTTSVIARTLDGTNLTSSFNVTITGQNIGISSLSIQGQGGINNIVTSMGQLPMQAIFSPAAPSNSRLHWSSSNPNIATISRQGIVQALRDGTVTISARSLDGSNLTATRIINISNQPLYVASLDISSPSGGNFAQPLGALTLQAATLPANAANGSLRWWSANPSIASIDASGIVRARQNGQARLFASTLDGSMLVDSLDINISNQPIFTSSLQVENATLRDTIDTPNGTLQLSFLRMPAIVSNGHLYWTVDNSNAAHISQTGLLSARSNADIVVTLRSQDASSIIDSRSIHISGQNAGSAVYVGAIDVFATASATQISTPNGSLQMLANVFPANADNQNLSWSVSDLQKARISASGLLTAQADGTVDVFASSQDGSKVSGMYQLLLTNQPLSVGRLAEVGASFGALLYPNPSSDILYLQLDAPAYTGTLRLSLYDAGGREIALSTAAASPQIDLSQWLKMLPSGAYFLRIDWQGAQKVLSFLSEK